MQCFLVKEERGSTLGTSWSPEVRSLVQLSAMAVRPWLLRLYQETHQLSPTLEYLPWDIVSYSLPPRIPSKCCPSALSLAILPFSPNYDTNWEFRRGLWKPS